jgi:hypothetical protein
MGILNSVVAFVEGVIDGARRTTPRQDDHLGHEPTKDVTTRQIMAEQFEESALDPGWVLEIPGSDQTVRLRPASETTPVVMGIDIAKEPNRTVVVRKEKRTRTNRGRNGPSMERLHRANDHGQFGHLIERVEMGDMLVTQALIEAGLEKPRTRVGNMHAEWIRASHEERREFLRLVMDKNLFDKPAHSGWLMRNPGFSTVPDGMRGGPTEVRD